MNLPKFRVVGDQSNKPRFSSDIIISSLNNAAKNVGLYSESDFTVVYDCIGNNHGYKADALIVCYELNFPKFVVDNCGNTPVIAVSRDNMRFAINGGVKKELCNYINLGVDTSIWRPVTKKRFLDKFVVLSYTESLTRSGLEILVQSFYEAFHDCLNDCVLFIKDRNATNEFSNWIHGECARLNINLIYKNEHLSTPEEEMDIFSSADCHVYLNKSTTWGMTVIQSMACGLPTISPDYSGPREFLLDKFSGLCPKYNLANPIHSNIELQKTGQRSFFFPMSNSDFWAESNPSSVAQYLKLLKNEPRARKYISENGIAMAKSFTWERSALMLSEALGKWYPL